MTRAMKDSGIIWLGKIPSNWNQVNYRRLFLRRKEYDDNPNKQVLSLTIEGVKEKNESFGKMAEDFTGHQKVHKGDLIFTPRDFDATPILSGVAPCDGCISNLYFVLYPRDKDIHISFYNYFMWGCKWGGDIWKKLSYGMRFSYNYQQFCSLPALSLPYEQQQKIADYLDDKCGKIDQAIEGQKKIIEKLKEYKQSVITEAVTKGLDSNVPMKDSGIEWIGQIPEHWGTIRLKNYAKICNGQDYKQYEDDNGIYPIIGSGGEFSKATSFLYDKESVLLGRKGTIDKPLYINVPFWTIDTMYYTRLNKNVNGHFFYYLCTTIHFDYYQYGSAVPSMTQRDLSNIIFSYPPFTEQQDIADFLDNKCAQIDKAIQQKEETITKLEEYKKSLIYECVTGKKEIG